MLWENIGFRKTRQDSLPASGLTEDGYLPFATAASSLYIKSKPLSHSKPKWYNIVVTPYMKYNASMTIYGQEFWSLF